MYKAIVFAGTTEGYALCEFLAENHVSVRLPEGIARFVEWYQSDKNPLK